MAKPDLGTKRQCPKCDTRFYDLGNHDPITCIECGNEFWPEQILKPRRPVAEVVEEKPKKVEKSKDLEDEVDDDDDSDDDDDDIDSILEVDDDDDDDDDIDVDVEDDLDADDK